MYKAVKLRYFFSNPVAYSPQVVEHNLILFGVAVASDGIPFPQMSGGEESLCVTAVCIQHLQRRGEKTFPIISFPANERLLPKRRTRAEFFAHRESSYQPKAKRRKNGPHLLFPPFLGKKRKNAFGSHPAPVISHLQPR